MPQLKTSQMVQEHLAHAVKTSGAHALGRELAVVFRRRVQSQLGITLPPFLDTPEGQALLGLLLPPLVHYVATQVLPPSANTAKVAHLAELANEGAANAAGLQLMALLTGLVEDLAGLAEPSAPPA